MIKITYYTAHEILTSSAKDKNLPLAVNNVMCAYTSSVKNIENSALFIIRNLISAYVRTPINSNKVNNDEQSLSENDEKIEYEYKLKDNLYENEKSCVELANKAIELMNAKKKNLIENKKNKLEKGIKLCKSTRKEPKKVKLDENGQPKESVVYYLKPFLDTINVTTFYQHIDESLIYNILKLKEQLNTQHNDLTTINSNIGQAAVNNAIENYKTFYQSIKSYYKNPFVFSGKPKPPGYHAKNKRCSFSLAKDRFKAKDNIAVRVITKDNIEKFSSIKDKKNINQLFIDTAKTIPVSDSDIKFYNQFNLMPFIQAKLNSVLTHEKEQLAQLEKTYNHQYHQSKNNVNNKFHSELSIDFVELKIIPLKHKNKHDHTVKLEVVLKHTLNLPQQSMLSRLLEIKPKFLELSDKDKIKAVQQYTNNSLKLSENINKNFNDLFRICNIDLGNKNLCTITFNNGHEGIVISGLNYFKDINKVDEKIDNRKSELNTDVIRLIQSNESKAKNSYDDIVEQYKEEIKLSKEYVGFINQDKITEIDKEDKLKALLKERLIKENIKYPELSKQDKALVEQYEKNCREDNYLINQQKYKNNYTDDFIHQLSTKIITQCLNERVNYLIIGKNDNWKENINIGRLNNRASYNFPHTELIEKLKYKALKFGIIVLVTEESYTSKTSFVHNVQLKTYNKNVDKTSNGKGNKDIKKTVLNEVEIKSKEINSINNKPRDKPLLSKAKRKENPYGGYRKNRDSYINKDKVDLNHQLKAVHSDMNGSFNMTKKVFSHVVYDPHYHNFNYRIVMMNTHTRKFKSIHKSSHNKIVI